MNDCQMFLKGNFRGLQHIGIPVTNLKRSVQFYSGLGFNEVLNSHVHVSEENDKVLVAFMEQNGVIIELYQVTKKNITELNSRKDGHIDHIAFDVADVEKAFN